MNVCFREMFSKKEHNKETCILDHKKVCYEKNDFFPFLGGHLRKKNLPITLRENGVN